MAATPHNPSPRDGDADRAARAGGSREAARVPRPHAAVAAPPVPRKTTTHRALLLRLPLLLRARVCFARREWRRGRSAATAGEQGPEEQAH